MSQNHLQSPLQTQENTAQLHLPRSEWPSHPNYPSQLLLLGSHRAFLRVSKQLLQSAREGGDPATIVARFRYLKHSMRSHEAYEEGKLYPYLEARWGLSWEHLRAGHHELEAATEAVFHAHAQGLPLAATLGHHHQVLETHLELEEAAVIPALLALSPQEFQRYYYGHISSLLRELKEA